MSRGPLDHPRLSAIAHKLDEHQLEEAQHLLSQLGDVSTYRHGIAFLTTRLLHLRGLLTSAQVIERLEALLLDVGDFPEAMDMIHAARSGQLDHDEPASQSSRPPLADTHRRQGGSVKSDELRGAFGKDMRRSEPPATNLRKPEFPQPARVPNLAPHVDSAGPERPPSIPDLDIPGGSVRAPGFHVEPKPQAAAAKPASVPPRGAPRALDRSQRYAAGAAREEVVDVGRKPSVPPAAAAPEAIASESRRAPRARPEGGVSGGPAPIISGAPPPMAAPVLTLFDVAKLLDAGRVDDALAALAERDSSEPDHVLMEARVRARAGHGAQARQLIQRLSQAPLLEPEIRAGVARLALELGETELAYAQAKRAHADDAEQPMVSLSLAWAAIRWTRRTADPESFRTAKRALMPMATRGGPNEALLHALRACVEAHGGRAVQAEQLARKALDIEPTADGFAALAMAAAALGRVDEVRQASARLRELDAAEADALEKSLTSNGDQLFCLDDSPPTPGTEEPSPTDIWGPLELNLLSDAPADAWSRFAQLATDTLAQVTGAARREGPALATVAASFLTVAPVSRDFAPFDETPWSLHRIAALLSLLSTAAKGTSEDSNSPVMKLLGAYVGEVLRQSLGLRWHGSLTEGTARLEGNGARHAPFDIVREHLVGKTPIPVERLLEQATLRASSVEPRPPAVEPPCPWDPDKWPSGDRLPSYAKALRHSVISQHCARMSAPLDGSPESVLALDAYLSLLAPDAAPPAVDTGWARRASVLAGAYAGQVLCDARDAEWLTDDSTELGPQSYGVRVGPGRVARPVLHAFERLTARGPSLSEWLELWL